MSIETKRRLADTFLRIGAMSDLNTRNLYVDELELQLGQSLNIRRHADAKHDIWAVVNACLAYPGALGAFAQVVRSIHGNSNAIAEVESLIANIGHGVLLTREEREDLLRLVTGVPREQVAAAYQVLLDAPDAPMPDCSDPRAVVGSLEAMMRVRRDRVVPLMFVEALAHHGVATAARESHRWVDDLGRRLGVGQEALRALCRQAREAAVPDAPDDGPRIDGAPVTEEGTPDVAAEPMGDTVRTTVPVASRAEPEPPELAHIWAGVPFRNPNFTGREELMRRLHDELTQHHQASVLPQTLHGFGGVGKTQLATEYVHRHRTEYSLVWWITADRPTDVLTSLAELGTQLGLPPSEDRQQTARMVLNELAASAHRWLLVYDNADKPDEIGGLVPTAGGHVILTSRNVDWTTRWHAVEVDVFHRGESIELLRKRDAGMGLDAADRLAEKLGDLPLALEQAINFQSTTGMPTEEYLNLLDERVADLLSEGKPQDYPTTVVAFLTLAFDGLRVAAPAAAELLDLFAFLGPEPISAGLLTRGRHAALSTVLGEALRDSIQMNRMIRELHRYGLAKVDPKGQRMHVHRLVQAVLRSEMDEQRRAQTQQNVRNLLAAASPSEPDKPENWYIHAEIGPHIAAADMIHAGSKEPRLVALDQARYLFNVGDYAASRDLSTLMVEAWSKAVEQGGLGADHEQTALAMRHLANALRVLGDYPKARQLDEEAFNRLRANPAIGDEHEHTVHTALGLGFDLSMAGDLVGALERDRENVDRATRVYNASHPDTLRARKNVASHLRHLGRFREAYEESSSIVREFQQTLGDSDARTVWAISECVYDLHGLGRYRDALESQLGVWELCVQLFKPHQRERLVAERNIVVGLRKSGDHVAALDRARKNCRAFEAHFGADHEYTLAAAMSLANALRAAGPLTEAREVASTAVELGYHKRFGERHRLTLAARVNFGIILRLLGERRAAYELEQATFRALTAELGEEHPYTLCAASNFANSLLLSHRVRESRELTRQTLEVSRRVRGEDHPDTLSCAVNMTLDHQDTEGDQAAQQRFDEVLEALERVLGPDHPDVEDAIRGKRADCDIEPPPI